MIGSVSSDLRHNRNCYAYLQQLIPFINNELLAVLPLLNSLVELYQNPYNAKKAYGDFYTSTLSYLEDHIDLLYPQLNNEQAKAIDDLIFALYHNDNHILEDAEWLKAISSQIRPQYSNTQEIIAHHLEDSSHVINKRTPKKAESLFGRFHNLFTPNFKPQLNTNIPSIKNHFSTFNLQLTEYRFGTQAQRHNGHVRISPLFKHWLRINAQRTAHQPISHIYFNNLGLDRGRLDIPGYKEKELSLCLHHLEEDPSLKTAVITLPAGKALMGSQHYKITRDSLSYSQAFYELFSIARYEHHDEGVVDFKISPKIRALLFRRFNSEVQQRN